MLVEEKKFQEKDGTIGYYDATYQSSNVLQTTYFPKANRLYISFNRGGVYSYENINVAMYERFKSAESQGKFFKQHIRDNSEEFPYRKEYTMYPDEVKKLKEVVEEFENKEQDLNLSLSYTNVGGRLSINDNVNDEEGTILFKIDNEDILKITNEGLFYKDEPIYDDDEIKEKFDLWINWAMNQNQIKLINWIKREFAMLEEKDDKTEHEEGQLHQLKIMKQWI